MSREGDETFVSVATSHSELSAQMKRGPVIRAQLNAAVVAERPDWRLIERLQSEERIWRAELARIAHQGELKLLRELSRRDRAIYLRTTMSDWKPSIIPILALKENRERTEAVRLEILASANCLIPDEPTLADLLAEKLQLELERQKLAYAWAEGLHATESPSTRLERLRKQYRSIGPILTKSVPPAPKAPNKTNNSGNDPR